MKLLVLDRKIRLFVENRIISNIVNSIRDETNVEDFWILCNPQVESNHSPLNINYKNFEDYNTDNVQKILEEVKPDVVLITNDYDFLYRSFIPAAKKLKIPTVLILQSFFFEGYLDNIDFNLLKGKASIVKEKWKEIWKNFWIMIKNYKYAKYSTSKLIKIIFGEISIVFSKFIQPRGKYNCDLILVSGNNWKRQLETYDINSKIVLTGRSLLDDLYKNFKSYEKKSVHDKTIITLMTTPMVEHKLWSIEEWEKTILGILKEIQLTNDFNFNIKIHPVSEKIEPYLKLIKKSGFSVPIYQKEDLSTIIAESDVIITYGYSSGTMEAILMKKPVIVVNLFDYPLSSMPFVKQGMVYELKDIKNLRKIMERIRTEKVDEQKYSKFISNTIFKFDGKASQRSSDAILDIIQKSKNESE